MAELSLTVKYIIEKAYESRSTKFTKFIELIIAMIRKEYAENGKRYSRALHSPRGKFHD